MSVAEVHKDLPVLTFAAPDDWLKWLEANHDQYPKGVWVKLAKKGAELKTISYEQAREGAIIYGWIDGLINGYNEQAFLTRFMARKSKSTWSKINRTIAEDLIGHGRMMPPGLKEVVAAKNDGRWNIA
jgi:uncharacterized protein YdeI (YjbR/CyaY-like superfamily)